MWLPPALLLLILPGCFSIQGPGSVRGPEQGSLTVQCRYDPKWKTYVKWWCKGVAWDSCQILVKTTGSEWKKDRVSITDNWTSHIFTVTMKELRRDDADTYWCGIERSGTDLGVQVVVTIDPEGTVMTSSENLLSRTIATRCGGLSSVSNVSAIETPSTKVFTSNLGSTPPLPVTTWPSTTRQDTPDPSQHPRPTETPSTKVFTSNLGSTPPLPVTTWPSTTRQDTPDPSQQLRPTETPSTKVFTSNLGPASSLPATTWPSTTRQDTPEPSQHPRSLLSDVHFLLLVFLELPLFLSMLSAVLWVNRPQKSSGRRGKQDDCKNQ